MKILVYTKTKCPWAAAVMAFLNAKEIPFEERDILKNPEYKKEVEEKTGQSKSPTLDFEGTMLPDASVEQVDEMLKKLGIE